jgi:phosphate/phosphite/phosphonate ABC transporter binding protein
LNASAFFGYKPLILLVLLFLIISQLNAQSQIKIGILALRGKEICLKNWTPLANYLDSTVKGYDFRIIPLDFEEVDNAVEQKEINYLFVNPAIYAQLEYLYNINRIATVQMSYDAHLYDIFGGVFFTTTKAGKINTLEDIKGEKVAAVNPRSFGGWLCQWRELKHHNIDYKKDFDSFKFYGTHDKVVLAVINGKADIGCVRTGILEKMQAEGKINLSDIKIINKQVHKGFFELASTQLYPEWPFAGLSNNPPELSKKIAVSLLSFDKKKVCDRITDSGCFDWTIPQDYGSVHQCLKDLEIKPYDNANLNFKTFLLKYKLLFILLTVVLVFSAIFIVFVTKLNKKIRAKNYEIEKSHRTLEQMVEQRTKELREKNKMLAVEIKERTIAEQNIKKLSLVVEQSSNLIFITDTNGITEYVNPAFEKITGYSFKEMTGNHFSQCIENDMQEEELKNMFNAIESGNNWSGEVTIKKKEHGDLFVFAKISPIIENESEIKHYVCIMEDITLQKKAEKALEDSEIRFKQLFESLGDAIFVTKVGDPDSGKILEINSAAEKQTGYTRDELIGKNIIKDLTVDGTSIFITMEREEELIQGKIIKLTEKKRRKDGSEYWTEVIVSPFNYKGQKASLSINRDISDRKKTEEDLIAALKKATESDRLKKSFLQNISHEIRTPMNGILSFSELLKSASLKDSNKEAIYSMMAESGQRMLNTLNDLMEISLAETGNLSLNISEFLVNEIIEDIITEYKEKATGKNLKFEYTNPDKIRGLLIKTDKKKLETVIKNLLDNAIKFTSEGKIELSFETNDKTLTIFVKDTGIGIPKDKQKAVFEYFTQADIDDKYAYQGSGLGLTISKIYVEMMGGKINMESTEGKGSVFYFSIPLQ